MKAINKTTSAEKRTVLTHKNSNNSLYCWLSKLCTTLILSIFLFVIVAPAEASTGSCKNKKCECRSRKTSFSYPVIKSNKKSTLYNKNQKKSRDRNYSFPV